MVSYCVLEIKAKPCTECVHFSCLLEAVAMGRSDLPYEFQMVLWIFFQVFSQLMEIAIEV
jgi:hypothetical protein